MWLLSLLMMSSISFAEAPFPKNWCSTGRCSAPQKEIWKDFNNGESIDWGTVPVVISGSCYHASPNYDNEHEHFSGFIIDHAEGGYTLAGAYYFFAESNPYAELDVDSARERFVINKDQKIEVFDDYAYYNTSPEVDNSVRNWFRLGDDGNIKMAVVFGSLNHFILCDLNQHEK